MKIGMKAKRIAMVGVIVCGNNVWAVDKSADLANEATTFRTLQAMTTEDIAQTKATLDGDAIQKGQIQTIIDKYGVHLKGFEERGNKYIPTTHNRYVRMANDMQLTLADDDQPTVTKALTKVVIAIRQLGFQLTDPSYKVELERLKQQRKARQTAIQQPSPQPISGVLTEEQKHKIRMHELWTLREQEAADLVAMTLPDQQDQPIVDKLRSGDYIVIRKNKLTSEELRKAIQPVGQRIQRSMSSDAPDCVIFPLK